MLAWFELPTSQNGADATPALFAGRVRGRIVGQQQRMRVASAGQAGEVRALLSVQVSKTFFHTARRLAR